MGLLHASLLNVFSEVELVALCEKSALMSRLFRKMFSKTDVCIVDNVEKIGRFDLDAVYVTTPISSHFPVISAIFSKKISRNVFVEKTLASNYDQSKELCALAKSVAGVTMVGYMKRFSVVFRKARELMSQGSLGELLQFKAYAYSSDFLGLTKESKSSASRGGALSDLGCHVIDLAMWMFGQLEVKDVLSVVKNDAGSETSVSFSALGSNQLLGRFDVSQSMPGYRLPEFGLSIEGSDGRIDVNDDRLLLTLADGTQRKWYRHNLKDGVAFSIGDPEYCREDMTYVASLLSNRQCEPSFEDASMVDRIIDQVRDRSRSQ